MSMRVFEFDVDRMYLLKLEHGKDLVEQLLTFLKDAEIKVAHISGIGAVMSAEIGYYDQIRREYVRTEVNSRCEIASLSGNVSLKDGEVFPHLHIVLCDEDGRTFSGHLFRADVFAAELFVVSLKGVIPERIYDDVTGLSLWK